jgi:Tol biopolymer transport system component/predicted Ser/Thr protein kinase
MALDPGTRLGPYEVVAPLGAGGMGEVYKARDTRLDRTVAIKVLPAHLSDDDQRRERFEREARAVSSLNHPHICTLHDIGRENGVDFMVMEHIEGETLADRLKKGALPLEQALRHAIEIADALDKAHRRGVVHRDLKPGNIMLTKAGAKLLDFGLAKLTAVESPGPESILPTEARPLTTEGSLVGTIPYMAPEQLEGREADARTDVFAFGAVLYEMVTGRRAFEGQSQASLIGAIMGKEPAPISATRPMSPPALDHAVARCLAKDAEERWQSAADLMRELKWVAEGGSAAAASVGPPPGHATRERLAWTAIVLALAGLAAWGLLRGSPPAPRPVSRLVIDLPGDQRLVGTSLSFAAPMALSPDGRQLVYSATSGGLPQLYLRSLDRFDTELIAGTEGGISPFFSPDGQWLGFFAGGRLQKVPLSGGTPQIICEAPSYIGNGITWGADGTIVFAQSLAGLARVSAEGGHPETLTTPDFDEGEYAHAWPQMLPDGKSVLFSVWGRHVTGLLSLMNGERRTLIGNDVNPDCALYLDTGHIVFGRPEADGLLAVPFDQEQLRIVGEPVLVLDIPRTPYSGWGASFAVSRSGTIVYQPARVTRRTLVWVDRHGNPTPVSREQGEYINPSLSPDGRRVVFLSFTSPEQGIWVYDLNRGSRTRVTKGSSSAPIWSADGKQISFASRTSGTWNLSSRSADGSGETETLLDRERSQFPMTWSPDGQTLAYYDYGLTTGRDIWMQSVGEEPVPFLVTPFNEAMLRFSPDGRYVAYVSDESGEQEVYVQAWPGPGERTVVSTDGGREPVWSRDGRELFYRNGDRMMAVSVGTGDTFTAGKPALLFSGRYAFDLLHDYDVSPDGQRFLMIQEDEEASRPRFHVVLNWFSELERLAPAGK